MSNIREMSDIAIIKKFVAEGYRKILLREPDPSGLEQHVNLISSGKLTRERFISALKNSKEYKILYKTGKGTIKDKITNRGITVCLICYNEEYWLPKTLPDMVKYSDKVVVIDGSPFGPSTDNTKKIIKSIIRPTDTYVKGKFGSERTANNWNIVMRNECLKYIDTTHVLVVDADEAFLPEDWKKLRDYANKGTVAVKFQYVHFYMDTSHILKGGIWDGLYHHFNIYRPDLAYHRLGSHLIDSNGKAIASYPGTVIDKSIRIFHYHRLSPPEVYKLKAAKFKKRSDGGNLSGEEYKKWLKNWKDDRSLNNKNIVPWKGIHPLEGKL